MEMAFTDAQQKVTELRGCNILVSAAAGSGKTAVLTERIVRMVCDENDPVDIDRLLVVTFTRAAAEEMRERIAKGINRELSLHPESEHIERQVTLLHNAQITTIDSFCMFILRNHFDEIGLDPAFRVADEGEVKLLMRDAMDELMEDRFADSDEAFCDCVEFFCPSGRTKVLEDYILDLYNLSCSFPWPLEWLDERRKDYPPAQDMEDVDGTGYGQYLLKYLHDVFAGCEQEYVRLLEICAASGGPYMYEDILNKEADQALELSRAKSVAQYVELFRGINFDRLPSKRDSAVDTSVREYVKERRGALKDQIKKMGERFFATPLDLAAGQAAECAAPVGMLIDLVQDFTGRIRAKKDEKKIVDFSDMEHMSLDILTQHDENGVRPSEVALQYREYFKEILIDEYQDSNLVQEYLLNAICGDCNRFMVGDVKQSIYKFRLARPELFLDKYDTYTVDEGICRRIDLSRNFRSRREVIDTVNGVFSRIMNKKTCGIDYDENAALYPGAVYPENEGCESELLLVSRGEGEKDAESLNAREREALAVAGRIKELLGSFKVTDKDTGKLRPVRFSDMVILLRTASGWDDEFQKILEEEGIPVYITSRSGYFSASEVQELLQILRIIDNPMQDIPLFGAMKSIFGGFSDEEIAQIRSVNKEECLYDALKEAADEDIGEGLSGKVTEFLKKIDRYRDLVKFMPIRDLLEEVIRDNDYLSYVTALPMGERRRANVEMLLNRASDFEKTSYHGLFHFIRYIEQLEKYDVDYGEAEVLDENSDVVRIMSIHHSKGLEFPVVFVCGLSKHFNMQDSNRSLIMDADMGLGVDYMNSKSRLRNKTLRRQVISSKMKADDLAEEMRILYVAFTRAKEKLIMSASLSNPEEILNTCTQWSEDEGLLYNEFLESTCFLDFLLPVADKSGICVRICDAASAAAGQIKEQISLSNKREKLRHSAKYADRDALKKLRESFSYEYPYKGLEGLYTKTTVSELKTAAMSDKDEASFHAFEDEGTSPYIPHFKRTGKEPDGTLRGNAYHKAMELMDFKGIYEALERRESMVGAIEDFLKSAVKSGRLSTEYRQMINDYKLAAFMKGGLAGRMYRAYLKEDLYREQPFVYGINAERLDEKFPSDETVLIQGIIDAYFIEDGQIVIVDYKTDAVSGGEELRERYGVQMNYYEEALKGLLDLPVKEKILYSFHLEECVYCDR